MDVKIESGWKERLGMSLRKDYFIALTEFVRAGVPYTTGLSSRQQDIQCFRSVSL